MKRNNRCGTRNRGSPVDGASAATACRTSNTAVGSHSISAFCPPCTCAPLRKSVSAKIAVTGSCTVALRFLFSSQSRPIANCLSSFLAWPTGSLRARRSASAACRLRGEGCVSEGRFIANPTVDDRATISSENRICLSDCRLLAGLHARISTR